MTEGLVRNLYNGEWQNVFSKNERGWHKRGKELLKKLIVQKRLYSFRAVLTTAPITDAEWCAEALESNNQLSLNGIITTNNVADQFQDISLVARIDRLSSVPWWAGRSPSVRLSRSITEYKKNLDIILRCANSIMFIDRNLDPTKTRYQDFLSLFQEVARRNPLPLIEVHRVCYIGSGRDREILKSSEWQKKFTDSWSDNFKTIGIEAEIFIWDDFHDRHVISDLIGIKLGNGFDTTTNLSDITTWSRLGRDDRDDIQREFDPETHRHNLIHRFKIPQ
ncbi:MAG: hypothetical protein H7A34_01740 [bacterium]|nr:hypothetical protein [bacterium]